MLDAGCQASPGMWYLLAAAGDGPCPRVGHACLTSTLIHNENTEDEAQPTSQQKQQGLVIVGGATPAGPFGDFYILALCSQSYKWAKRKTESLTPRYEHAILETTQGDIYVFGGAQQDHNLNSVQVLKNGETKWTEVLPKGCIPAPRTSLNVATIGNNLYIFGGGLQGASPVSDTKLHVFNADECSWTQLECKGNAPSPRHGHLAVALDKKIFIHGGMAEAEIYSDLHVLDLETNSWHEIKQSGSLPSARAAHAGTVVGRSIYIFGGMNLTGALCDLYKFDTDFLVWSKIEIDGSPPPPRLDHTLCCIDHPIIVSDGNEKPSIKDCKKQKLLVSFGGMDTTGQIFNDLFAIAVE